MRNFTIFMAVLFCMSANLRMQAQTPSDNKLWYAAHAGDYSIHCRVNFYVFSATPISIDSLALTEALERINNTWNGNTMETIGGNPTGVQMIPTNVFFHMNAIIPIVYPETSDLANWEDYMLYYDSTAFWHMTHFVDDSDSIIDIIFVNNTLSSAQYSMGHFGLGISVMNIETGDIDVVDLSSQMGRVFGLSDTYGGDTISVGTDMIPDTHPEAWACGDSCSNNIMGHNPDQNYFTPMQTGWIRKAIIADSVCMDDLAYGEYYCLDLVEDLSLGNYDLHRYIHYGPWLSIQDPAQEVLSIYPNPATDYIRFAPDQYGDNVQIFNTAGNVVSITSNYQGQNIQVDQLTAGIYYVRYGKATAKFVVSGSSW